MKSVLVVNGRLAWPAVATYVFLAASIIVFDMAWRVLTVSIEALALSAALVVIVGVGLIIVLARSSGRRRRE
jgi:hypothetical protein